MARRYKLSELHPQFVVYSGRDGDPLDALYFDCPEAHGRDDNGVVHCWHTIPFKRDLNGQSVRLGKLKSPQWERVGDDLATLTVSPSIRCRGFCNFHVYIKSGAIEFCKDSK